MFKVGKELFTAEGPQIVRSIVEGGGSVFLELKFHDIPNTVEACHGRMRLLAVVKNPLSSAQPGHEAA